MQDDILPTIEQSVVVATPAEITATHETGVAQNFTTDTASAGIAGALTSLDLAAIGEQINAGVSALFPRLVDSAALFDGLTLPVVPADLGDTLGVRPRLASVTTPTIPAQSTVGGLIGALEAAGFTVLSIEGGFTDASRAIPDTTDAGDLIRLRHQRTLGNLAGRSPFEDDTLALLQGLPPSADLAGLLRLAGDLQLDLTLGVDAQGFYLLDGSEMALSVTGGGDVGGTFPLTAGLNIAASGSAGTDDGGITVSLLANAPGDRARIGDLAGQLLARTANGDATVSLDLTLQPLGLTWPGEWSLSVAGTATTVVPDVTFPCTDDLIAAFLPFVSEQFETFLGSEVLDLLESAAIPLSDGNGPVEPAPGGDVGLSDFAFKRENWFRAMLGHVQSFLRFGGVIRTPSGYDTLGQGPHYTVGDALLGANLLREAGFEGQGVRIGLISDGMVGLEEAQGGANADIPSGQVTLHPQFSGGPLNAISGPTTGAEGTAMAEIIFDIAPAVEVFFAGVGTPFGAATPVDAKAAFLEGLRWFQRPDVDVHIVVDDMGFFGEPWFEDGAIATAAKDLADAGVLFVSAAGNDKQTPHPARCRPTTPRVEPLGDLRVHEFAPGLAHLPVELAKGESVVFFLQWNEPFSAPAHAGINLFLLNQADGVLESAVDPTKPLPGALPAARTLRFTNPSTTRSLSGKLVISVPSGPDESRLVLELFSSKDLGLAVPDQTEQDAFASASDQIIGHPAVQSPPSEGEDRRVEVLTVGAIDADSANSRFSQPASYSSVGHSSFRDPADPDGLEERETLDVMGIAGVEISGAGGFGRKIPGREGGKHFFGTSAAAPHVAAVAALLKSFRPQATAQDIIKALRDSAKDLHGLPQAVEDSARGLPGQSVPIPVLANDVDLDWFAAPNAQRLPVTLQNVSGVPDEDFDAIAGIIHYTASDADEFSVKTLTYQIEDDGRNVATGEVTVFVGESFPLFGVPDGAVTTVDTVVPIPVLDNDRHLDGLPIRLVSADETDDTRGIVDFDAANGVVLFMPDPGFEGETSFRYTIEAGPESETFQTSAEVTVVVVDPALPPQDFEIRYDMRPVSDLAATTFGTPVGVPVLRNDISPSGRPLSISNPQIDPEFGTAIVDGDMLVVTPARDVGADIIFVQFTVSDGVQQAEGELELVVDPARGYVPIRDRLYTSVNTPARSRPTANDLNGALGRVAGVFAVDRSEFRGGFDLEVNQDPEGNEVVEVVFTPEPGFEGYAGQLLVTVQVGAVSHESRLDIYVVHHNLQEGPDRASGKGRVNAPLAAEFLADDLADSALAPLNLPPSPDAPAPPGSAEPDGGTAAPGTAAPQAAIAQQVTQPASFDFAGALQALGVTIESAATCEDLETFLTGGSIGDFIRLRYRTDQVEFSPFRADFGFDASGIPGLAELGLQGRITAEALPLFDIGFGFDSAGVFLSANSHLDAQVTGSVTATGSLGGVTATATGALTVTPRLSLSATDANGDGKLRVQEFLANLGNLQLQLANVSTSVSLDALSFEIPDILRFTAQDAVFDPDPQPGDPVATLDNVLVELLAFPDLKPSARVGGIELFDDPDVPNDRRVEIANIDIRVEGPQPGAPVVIGTLLELVNAKLRTSNLVVNLDTGAFSLGAIELVADGAALLPDLTTPALDGVATVEDGPDDGRLALTGRFELDGDVVFTFDTARASIEGVVGMTATGGFLALGPGAGNLPLLRVNTATATLTLPGLGKDLAITGTGLEVSRTGAFTVDTVALVGLQTVGIAGLLPFTIQDSPSGQPGILVTGVAPNQPIALDAFTVQVTGALNLAAFPIFAGLNLPAQPVVKIGNASLLEGQPFTFTIGFNQGAITLDTELITLGFVGLELGPITVDATVTLGRFAGGAFDTSGFDALVDVDFEGEGLDLGASLAVGPDGLRRDPATGETTLDLIALFDVSFANDLIDVTDAQLSLGLLLTVRPDLTVRATNLALTGVQAAVTVHFGDVMSFRGQAGLNFSAGPDDLLATFLSLSADFPGLNGIPALAGLGGTVTNFGITGALLPKLLAGFSVTLNVDELSGDTLGLEWLPVSISELGFEFKVPGVDPGDVIANPVTLGAANPADIVLIISGGIDLSDLEAFPIAAEVRGLRLNLGALARGDIFAAVEGVEGGSVGPFTLGPVEIGGGLAIEVLRERDESGVLTGTQVLVVTVNGFFAVAGFGGGIQLMISEVGPIGARVDVPLAVPLGPTGLILSGVGGGFAFGGDPIGSPPTPQDLLTNELLFDPLQFSADAIAEDLFRLVRAGQPTWLLPLRIILDGTVTTVATPGILEGVLTIGLDVDPTAAAPEVKFFASGEVTAFGIPLGQLGALLDFTNPLAPIYSFALKFPTQGNPLAFLFPLAGEYSVRIDTTGVVDAVVVGLQTFVTSLASGAFEGVLGALADLLQAQRTRPLAQLVLNGPTDTRRIDADLLAVRLPQLLQEALAALPLAATPGIQQAEARAARIVNAILSDVFDAAGQFFAAAHQDPAVLALRITEFVTHLQGILTTAALQALAAADSVFDPSFELSGSLQPTILGIPFGDALVAGSVAISKTSLEVEFSGSIQRISQKLASLSSGPLGELFAVVASGGFSDQFEFFFELDDLGIGIFPSLFGGQGLPDVNPLGKWTGGLTGTLQWLGFDLAEISGLIFSPGNLAAVDARTRPDPLTGSLVVGDQRIPITGPDQETVTRRREKLIELGGILLTGRLLAPALLVDPIGRIAELSAPSANRPLGMFTPPSDVLGLPGYVGTLMSDQGLLADQELARLQLYVPAFASVLALEAVLDADPDQPGNQTGSVRPVLTGAIDAIISNAYFSGFVGGFGPGQEAKFLSIPIGRLLIDGTSSGFEISGEIPFLGATVEAELGKRDVNAVDLVQDLVTLVGLDLDLGGVPPLIVPLPVARLEASLSTSRLEDFLADRFGLPRDVFGSSGLEASLQVFSPGFAEDPGDGSVPLIQSRGGVELDVTLDLEPFIDNAAFHFESVLFADGLLPEFVASASVDRITIPGFGALPGDILSASLHLLVARQDGELSLRLDDPEEDPAVPGVSLRILDDLLSLEGSGALTISSDGIVGFVELGVGALATSIEFQVGDLRFEFEPFSLDAEFRLELNTTSQEQLGIPEGFYLGLHAAGDLRILGLVSLGGTFDLVLTDEGFVLDATGTLGIDFPEPIPDIGGSASAHLELVDGRAEGTFRVGGVVVTLDRWGGIYVNGVEVFDIVPDRHDGGLVLDGFNQQVHVDNQRFRERDSDRTRGIAIGLSRPAERPLRVNYRLEPDTALEGPAAAGGLPGGGDWTGSDGHIVIPKNATSGEVEFTVEGDSFPEDDEALRIEITDAFYLNDDETEASEDFLTFVADPLPGDWDARITIEDDDQQPSVIIEPVADVNGETVQDGARRVFVGTVVEGKRGALALRADNIGPGQSIQIEYTLSSLDPSRTTATHGEDFLFGAAGQGPTGVVTLTGEAPEVLLAISTTDDTAYELHELFEATFALRSFTTDEEPELPATLVRMTLRNDDLDRRGLVFYDFDTLLPGVPPGFEPDPTQPGPGPYVYDQAPDYTDPLVRATPFVHRDDEPNSVLAFTDDAQSVIADAGVGPTIPGDTFTIDFWIRPGQQSGRANVLAVPGAAPSGSGSQIGLSIFLEDGLDRVRFDPRTGEEVHLGERIVKYEARTTLGTVTTETIGAVTEGEWHHVALTYGVVTPLGESVIGYIDGQSTLAAASPGRVAHSGERLMLGQAFFVEGTLHLVPGFLGHLDEVRIWSAALRPADALNLINLDTTGAESDLVVQFRLDEGRGLIAANAAGPGWAGELGNVLPRTVTPGVDFGPSGRPEWRLESGSPVGQRPRYENVSTEDPDGFPKVSPVSPVSDPTSAIRAGGWARPGTPIEEAPYYTFVIGRDASTGGLSDTRQVIAQIGALRIDGVDFFHRAATGGPARWELRSSFDGFETVLAQGVTATGEDYVQEILTFENSLFPIHPGQLVEFRLYGLDAVGNGAWTAENFALTAGVAPPATFNLPPRGVDFFFDSVPGSPSTPIDPTKGASDPDRDPVGVIDAVLSPVAGTLLQNADGTFVFTRAAGLAGDIPITFTLADRWGALTKVVGTARLRLDAVNDAFTINEDATLAGNVLANDSVVTGTAVKLVGSPPPSQAFALNANGTFTFTPVRDFAGTVSFAYSAEGGGASDQATVAITVRPVNDAPVANPDSFKVEAGKTLTVVAPGILGNDVDAEKDTLRATLVSTVASGTLTVAPDGSFAYTPKAGFSGTDGFVYTASDGIATSAKATVTITVTPPNLPPDAVEDSVTVAEDNKLFIPIADLLANDRDPEGGPVTFVSATSGQHGTVGQGVHPVTGAPALIYTPGQNFNGPDSFVYTARDAAGLTDTATVQVSVTPVNDAPIAVNDSFSLDTRLQSQLAVKAPGLLANDRDVDGDGFSAALVNQPTAGSVTVAANGAFTYTPGAGFIGNDFFRYRLFDTQGAPSAVATVTINVFRSSTSPQPPPPTNPPPVTGGTTSTTTTTLNGYVADARVFFDANLNWIWDFTDLDGNGQVDPGEPAEPVGTTADDGSVQLAIPADFDTDGSGFIELDEGVLVSTGGMSLSSTHAERLPLRAPLGSSLITPLTSLLTSLALEHGHTAFEAQARVLAALGLPDVELLTLDPVTATMAGDAVGAAVLVTHKQLADTHVQIGRFLHAASGEPPHVVGAAVMAAVADVIAPAGATLDLTSEEALAGIVAAAAQRLGVFLEEQDSAAVGSVIAEGNRRIAALEPTADPAYMAAVTRIESAAQGAVTDALVSFAKGAIDAATLLARYTGPELDGWIVRAPVALILPPAADGPRLENLVATDVFEGGSTRLTANIVGAAPTQALAVLVNWGDGIVVTVPLAPGSTLFERNHLYADDDPTHASTDRAPMGLVLLIDGVATDVAAVSTPVSNIAPEIVNLVHTPLVVAGGPATITAALTDPSALDTFTVTVAWGDGQVTTRPVTREDGITGSHAYTTPGNYTVTLTVADDDGGTTSRTLDVVVIEPRAPAVEAVLVDDGSAQRSLVRSLTVTFDQPVEIDPFLASLVRHDGVAYTLSAANPTGDSRTWVLSFFGPETAGGSLPDGDFTLTIAAGAAVNALGAPLAGDHATTFHRLFGDLGGDGNVDAADRAAFRAAFGSRVFDPGFVSLLDVNGDDVIDALDARALGREPLVDAGLDRTVDEGTPLTIVATFEGFGAGHTAVIDWGDGTVEPAVVAETAPGLGSATGAHVYRDDGAFEVRVLVSDTDGFEGDDTITVTAVNVAPETRLLAATSGLRGLPVTFTGTFTDPGTLDTHEVAWDFGDGTGIPFHAATDPGALAPEHVFADAGHYIVTLSVRDDDGGTDSATRTFVARAAARVADPADPDAMALVVAGTAGDDRIRIVPADLPRGQSADGRPKAVKVLIDGVSQGVFAHTGRIIVEGFAGDDDIVVDGSVENKVELRGGAGDDRLKAGGGRALLLGGAGDDRLIGGPRRDVLIGGTGADRLSGGERSDLLIAGHSPYDDDPQALATILREWTADLDYDTRVARLTRGVDGVSLTAATVLDDGVKDTLTGGAGRDWLFATVGGRERDKVNDWQWRETLTALRPGGWVSDFVLNLGDHDPNKDIRIVPAGVDTSGG